MYADKRKSIFFFTDTLFGCLKRARLNEFARYLYVSRSLRADVLAVCLNSKTCVALALGLFRFVDLLPHRNSAAIVALIFESNVVIRVYTPSEYCSSPCLVRF